MKHKFMKAIACLSLVVMVLSAVTPGAFADDTGTASDTAGDQKMGHGPRGGPGMDSGSALEAMEFDSEEEELEFLVERTTESINNQIEKLNEMLENIDEIDDEDITEETIEEQIAELEALLEEVEAATTVDELKEIMENARDSMMPAIKGERPEMEFETEEEEMEFLIERQTEFISHRIERLNDMLENIDEIDDENITEDSIEEQIAELEALQEDIEGATTLDELKEILEEYRESNPQTHEHGRAHGHMDTSSEEEITAE